MPDTKNPSEKGKKVWFITGCSTGFGRELAMLVLDRSYRAVVTARDPAKAGDIAAGSGDRALVRGGGAGDRRSTGSSSRPFGRGSSGSSALTVASVPTGMKAGVSTGP